MHISEHKKDLFFCIKQVSVYSLISRAELIEESNLAIQVIVWEQNKQDIAFLSVLL